jgi:Ca2+-binding RTX toxin-like protein
VAENRRRGIAVTNSYTFKILDPNDLVSAAIEASITIDAQYVIGLVSRFIDWKGTMDFVVEIRPASELTWSDADGLLPSFIQAAWTGSAWTNQTMTEARTGIDPNPNRPDAGLTIYLADDGTIKNYGAPVWFDPNPGFEVNPAVPSGMHDFVGILTHEIFHSLGFVNYTQEWAARMVSAGDISYFTGARSEALYGGAIPFRTGSDHYGYAQDSSVPIKRGLMYEYGNYQQNRLDIGRIDLAMLADMGYTIKTYDGLSLFEMIDTATSLTGTGAGETLYGDYHSNAISGGGGDDSIEAGSGDDELSGGDGNDVLGGGGGVDSLSGGADSDGLNPAGLYGDQVSFFERSATEGVVADLRTGIISNDGFGNSETMTGIESLGGDTVFADTFYGNDSRNGLAGSLWDNLFGLGGDDLVVLNARPRVADGGEGTDTLVLLSEGSWYEPDMVGGGIHLAFWMPEGWYVNLDTGRIRDGFVYRDGYGEVAGFENVTGSNMPDEIFGDSKANIIRGGDGGDALLGLGGDDQLFGGDGNDYLTGGAGVDNIDGGSENGPIDLFYNEDGDLIGFFDPYATQAAVADLRNGTIANDGFGNAETMVSIEGISGGTAFADTFFGNDDRNVLGGSRGDTIYGFGGDDRIELTAAPALVDAGEGNDRLQLVSGAGWLAPDSDGDGMAEVVAGTTVGWQVDLGSGAITDGHGNSGSVAGFEWVTGGGRDDGLYGSEGADRLDGSDGDDILLGRGGDDSLSGDRGNDLLDGGAGADMMTGSLGDDSYVVDNAGDSIVEYAGHGTDEVRTALAVYSLAAFPNVENLSAIYGVDHDLGGNGSNNVVTGLGGSDVIRLQHGGDDSAVGGGGNDQIFYGAAFTAADSTDGGSGTDVLVLQGDYVVTLAAGSLTNVEYLSLQSGSSTRYEKNLPLASHDYDITFIDANVGAGQRFVINASQLLAGEDFTFNGAAETDGSFLVYGGFGADVLTGGAGHDVFHFEGSRWGSGDSVNGGAGADSMVIRAGSGVHHIEFSETQLTSVESISVSDRFGLGQASLPSYEMVLANGNVAAGATLIVNGSTLLDPGQFIDVDGSAVRDGHLKLYGGAGADTLIGGAGNDLIFAAGGADRMTGGEGQDTFQFRSLPDSTASAPDEILDFVSGVDKIDLGFIDANSNAAGNQAFTFVGAAFSGAAGELRAYQDSENGAWYVEGDVNGDGNADFQISVVSPGPLVSSDFIA